MEHSAARIPKAKMSAFSFNLIKYRSPFVVMWWSAAIPGFGHLMLGQFAQGFVLIGWEFAINHFSNLNESIYYAMVGEFKRSKEDLNLNWLLLYIAVYVFTIWDSYRRTIILNKFNYLAESSSPSIPIMHLTPLGLNYIYKYRPSLAVLCSLFMPGLGHVYLQKLLVGAFLLASWVTICFKTQVLIAIHYTCIGDFHQATVALNPQWLLFLPSVYCFSMADSYHYTITMNKCYEEEQAHYLLSRYKDTNNSFLIEEDEGNTMKVAASYKSCLNVEILLADLEEYGIPRNRLMVLPLHPYKSKRKKHIDYIYEGEHMMNLAFPFGTVFMLLGVIYGFVLPLGPILWGLFGLVFGFLFGYGIWVWKRKRIKVAKLTENEIVICIHTEPHSHKSIKEIMSRYDPIRMLE